MTMSPGEIISDIKSHIEKFKVPYTTWYVAVTNDAEKELFINNKIDKYNDLWIYREVENSEIALKIKTDLTVLGLQGTSDSIENTEAPIFVYAYKK
jgi:hypothetical protein